MNTLALFCVAGLYAASGAYIIYKVRRNMDVASSPAAIFTAALFWPAFIMFRDTRKQLVACVVIAALLVIWGISLARAAASEFTRDEIGLFGAVSSVATLGVVGWWFAGRVDKAENDNDHPELF